MQTLSQKMARNKIKAYSHCISDNFRSGIRKNDKNALEIGYPHFKRSPNFSIFVIKYQSFAKFSIRWPVSRYIL